MRRESGMGWARLAVRAALWLLWLGAEPLLGSGQEELDEGLGRGNAPFLGDRVVDAINCGGPAHTDVHGIAYREDRAQVGTASDHGKRFLLGRVPQPDQILYQTERYHIGDFDYTFKIPEDGQYTLVLKFSEVYFTQAGQKVFDVHVNEVPVLQELDIFGRVGRAVAHDELVPLAVRDGRLTVAGTTAELSRKLRVSFVKGAADNPKVNAILLLRGGPDDVPHLPDLEEEEPEPELPPRDPEESPRLPGESPEEAEQRRAKLSSGPKTPDPYQDEDQSQLLIPVLVVVLCFVPVLFCLCKL